MQRGVQRAVFYLQNVVGGALNMLSDLMSMSWTEQERAENEHVEGTLQEFPAVGRGLGIHDSRCSTTMEADALPSIRLARKSW